MTGKYCRAMPMCEKMKPAMASAAMRMKLNLTGLEDLSDFKARNVPHNASGKNASARLSGKPPRT